MKHFFVCHRCHEPCLRSIIRDGHCIRCYVLRFVVEDTKQADAFSTPAAGGLVAHFAKKSSKGTGPGLKYLSHVDRGGVEQPQQTNRTQMGPEKITSIKFQNSQIANCTTNRSQCYR